MSHLADLIIGDRSATAPAGWSRTSLARIRVSKTGSAQTSRRDDDLNSVEFHSAPAGIGGWCDAKARRIVVVANVAPNAQRRTLIHESAHALGIDYQRYTREQAEVMVDTITFIVCTGLGLAIAGKTIP